MNNTKQLGIWMDHSEANLIDLNEAENCYTIDSKFTYEVKDEAIRNSEHVMHNKEQQMHEAFYKEIGSVILKYDDVLLFGPTKAKTELHNYLQKDSHYKNIKIEVEAADKMRDNEKNARVKSHFEKQ
jgi:hypothetical protein